MHPLDDELHDAADRAAVHDRVVRRPLRRLLAVTALTGALSAAAAAGVLALQSRPAYARAVLEARSWGATEVTDADVAAFLTAPAGVVTAVVGVLVATALLVLGIARRVRAVRPVGSVLAVLALLTATFWMVDGGRMVQAGGAGPIVLGAVVGMAVSSAAWLLIAQLRSTRDAFDG